MAKGLKKLLENSCAVYSLAIVTDGSGDFSGAVAVDGVVRKVAIVIGTLAATSDFTFSDNQSLENIHVKSSAVSYAAYPKVQNVDSADSAISGQYTAPYVGTMKVVVAQGGDTKAGTAYIYVDR